MTHPAYGRAAAGHRHRVGAAVRQPGLMTLDGTNTWVLRGRGSDEIVIVDPGPDDDAHIERVAALGRIVAGADQPPPRRPHRRHRQAGRRHRRGGAVGRQRISARPRRPADRRRGDRRGGPADHGDGDAGPYRRLVVVPARRRGADRRHRAGPRHHRHRQRGRQPARLSGVAATAARARAAGRCCPGTAPTCADLEAVTRCTWRTARSGSTRCAGRCANSARTPPPGRIVEHVYIDVDEKLWDAAEMVGAGPAGLSARLSDRSTYVSARKSE